MPSDIGAIGQPATFVPPHLDTILNRDQLARALTAVGFKTTAATLATMAVRGGGPPFRKFGRRTIYSWGEALEWAEARVSAPVTSTAELAVKRQLGKAERR